MPVKLFALMVDDPIVIASLPTLPSAELAIRITGGAIEQHTISGLDNPAKFTQNLKSFCNCFQSGLTDKAFL